PLPVDHRKQVLRPQPEDLPTLDRARVPTESQDELERVSRGAPEEVVRAAVRSGEEHFAVRQRRQLGAYVREAAAALQRHRPCGRAVAPVEAGPPERREDHVARPRPEVRGRPTRMDLAWPQYLRARARP